MVPLLLQNSLCVGGISGQDEVAGKMVYQLLFLLLTPLPVTVSQKNGKGAG